MGIKDQVKGGGGCCEAPFSHPSPPEGPSHQRGVNASDIPINQALLWTNHLEVIHQGSDSWPENSAFTPTDFLGVAFLFYDEVDFKNGRKRDGSILLCRVPIYESFQGPIIGWLMGLLSE